MQVGDLVKNRHGNTGIITKRYGFEKRKTWWIHWLCGDNCPIHERFIEVIQKRT